MTDQEIVAALRQMRAEAGLTDSFSLHEHEVAALDAAISRLSATCGTCETCQNAKNVRDITDEYRTVCPKTNLDVTDAPEGFGCHFYTSRTEEP